MGGKPRRPYVKPAVISSEALGDLGRSILPQVPSPMPGRGLARLLGYIKKSQEKHLGQTGSLNDDTSRRV